MTIQRKPATALTASDLEAFPVWEFVDEPSDDEDETWVTPSRLVPAKDLDGKVIGTRVVLADGSTVLAGLANIDLQSSHKTKHFLLARFERNGKWFNLARYQDADREVFGPMALAAFLGRRIEQVFPIRYDISKLAVGSDDVLRGIIHAEPNERLSDSQLMDLILE